MSKRHLAVRGVPTLLRMEWSNGNTTVTELLTDRRVLAKMLPRDAGPMSRHNEHVTGGIS